MLTKHENTDLEMAKRRQKQLTSLSQNKYETNDNHNIYII